MKKYQMLHKALSLRRIMVLSAMLTLFALLNILPMRVLAANSGAVTTADKTYAFDYKTHIPWVGAANSLFKASFNIPSPGTSTIDGDRYQGTLTFTKLPNSDYRLVKVIPYMDSPTFTITNSGGSTAAAGSYNWNEALQAWTLPNPLIDNTATSVDTSQALNGSVGIKIYMAGPYTSFMPLSTLKNDLTLLETRPVFLVGDVAALAPNLTQNIPFTLYQERAYDGDPNKWHAFNFNVPALVQYEYDGQVTGTNPDDQLDLIPGDLAHFESEVNLSSPQKITVDMIWQVSKDKGLSFNDISESLANSTGDKTIRKTLDFTSDISNEGSLYRLKITPLDSINNEPIYTEPAVLTFKSESLSFNIAYVLNGGTNHPANPLTYSYGQGISRFEAPQREGYTFTGWTDGDGNSITNIPTDAQGDKTLHANWKANTYKINYVLNGGENSRQNPDSYIYGRGVSHFEQATKQGYTFTGWTDQKGKKIEAISAQEQGDKVLYTSWEKVPVVSNENEEPKNEEVAKKQEDTNASIKIEKSAASLSTKKTQDTTRSHQSRKQLPLTGENAKPYLYVLGVSILVALSLLGVKKYLIKR
ncbi:InlB B-repeat-containing protein [Lactococcus formosensis]|uniref:InlB B-repeat-containing protein n=1 Tax=Lactococcus formosensis TaxID=1281486 RepID=A0A9X4P988_9LACT|nr:InlB B-repeat-containing protein [Lactococcus formosensis]MDG6142911.1 InlB B-repeat-containing protein [Lactococcus formosensis]MDG6156205.1 InlB B-repeat-containing protein [Lactococcus formosensis]MDG6160387.1 InlB B-repeat-containing protein [Lactococcus formosensis]MDG6167018.1 InlB B-repeat-containing protein [Lactococcus formosensis]MDG6173287.1 InlB B-repeat-containing protein [Lactococcus formosensis]